MDLKRTILKTLAEFDSILFFNKTNPSTYRILMYHSVGGRVINDVKNIFSIDPKQFEDQIAYLASLEDLHIVDLSTRYLENDKNYLTVTFDDGYKDNLYIAAPILEKYQIPFTVFVSSGFVKSNSQGFLNENELKELSKFPNATIGGHSVTHPSLVDCNDKDLENELNDCKNYIQDIIGKTIDSFAYPFGRVNQRVRDAVEKAGFKVAATSYMNTNFSNQDNLMLSRTSILGIDSNRIFRQKISGNWDWYRFIQDYRKSKVGHY